MKWEYATENAEADLLDLALSNRDKDGWEFVALSMERLRRPSLNFNLAEYVASDYRLVFRRPSL